MNLPNKLSLTRICLVPAVIVFLSLSPLWCRYAAGALFAIASLTDMLDGKIARKYNLVTNFGKFIDPVADKVLVLSTMVALCGLQEFPFWAVIVVLFRELAVDGLRLVACEQGKVIAAGKLGKAKTTLQISTLLWILFRVDKLFGNAGTVITQVLICLLVLLTLISGSEYFIRNRNVLFGGLK